MNKTHKKAGGIFLLPFYGIMDFAFIYAFYSLLYLNCLFSFFAPSFPLISYNVIGLYYKFRKEV